MNTTPIDGNVYVLLQGRSEAINMSMSRDTFDDLHKQMMVTGSCAVTSPSGQRTYLFRNHIQLMQWNEKTA